jgi:glyoxylase-like metal-dependent hydrolase (beta-lactamase superfamily II)
MQIDRLESDIYVLVGKTYGSNSTAFINGDEVLLVDAMASRTDAEELKDFVEKELKKQVRFIICTHYFSDHMAALKLFPQAQIIAHKNYMHTFTSEKHRSAEEEAHFVEPTIQISDGLVMKWGRYTLDIFYNPGHNMSTINIDVPEADLLMIGDTVVGNLVYLLYSTPEMFISALKRAQRRNRGRLITSHQSVRSGKAIDNALYYVDRLQENVSAARRSSASQDAILDIAMESCLPAGVEGTAFERISHMRNLESIIEKRLFATAT